MPNWCDTTVRFTGTKEDVYEAYKAIEAINSVPDSSVPGRGWLGYLNESIYPDQFDFNDFLKQLNNADKKDHTSIKKNRYELYSLNDCRGWIQNYSVYLVSDDLDKHGLEISIMDAWRPHIDILQYFALRYNLGMSMSWEEPGGCLYGNYDPAGTEDWPTWAFDIRLPEFENRIHCTYDELQNDEVEWPAQFTEWLAANKRTITSDNIELLAEEFMQWLENNDPEFAKDDYWFIVNRFEDVQLNLPTEIPEYEKPEY